MRRFPYALQMFAQARRALMLPAPDEVKWRRLVLDRVRNGLAEAPLDEVEDLDVEGMAAPHYLELQALLEVDPADFTEEQWIYLVMAVDALADWFLRT